MRRRAHARRGAAALEFALVLPVVTFVMTAVLDYGAALQQIIRLEGAARAGAQVAMSRPNDADAIRAAALGFVGDWAVAADCGAEAPDGVCVQSGLRCRVVGGTADIPCSPAPTTDFHRYAWVTITRPYSPILVVPDRTLRGNVEIRLR